MKLLRYVSASGSRLGLVSGEGIVDLANAGCAYSDMLEIIREGQSALDRIATATNGRPADLPLAGAQLLAPFRPGKFLAIAMNYQQHVEESVRLGVEAPKHQFWFNKQTTCISGPFDSIEPGVSEKVDYEVELGVVIGRVTKGVSADDALAHVFGYVVANDVTARDWQFHSPTFTMGKSFDTHGPIGPWIITADEIPDPQNLELRCFVNGEVRQSNNTSQMIHSVTAQIEYLSTAFTLEPGDLIATGTPEGVGVAMVPPTFLQAGDIVRCEIEGVGTIENRVAG